MKKLLVVIGAGASIEFGMPSVITIDQLFDKWAQRYFPLIDGRSFDDNLYRWVNENYKVSNKDNSNFEDTLYTIQTLSSFNEGDSRKVLRQSDYTTINDSPKIRAFNGYETIAETKDFFSMHTLLNEELIRYFRSKCSKLEIEKKPELENVSQFFNYLKSDYELGFINLNYDNVVLSAIPELKTGFDSDTGKFDMSTLFKDDWNFCYHIHGSAHFDMRDNEEIFWNKDLADKFGLGPKNRRSFETPEGLQHPLSSIITGLDKINQIYREPFRQYFFQLNQKIHESDTILFIGYGFNDAYLNDLMRTHSKDKSKRRNIVVIDYQDENLPSLSEGGNEWGDKLLNAAATPFHQMGNGSTNLVYRPNKVSEYKNTRTFEFSDSYDNPLYVWYSGFLDACKNKEKVKKALDGYDYEPDGSLSKTKYI